MMPELGYFALILALCFALIQSFFSLSGATFNKPAWMLLAKRAVFGQFAFLVTAFILLAYSFVTDDFSVVYVAENANSHLPLFYRIAALWGGHEGSLLLWVTILSTWTTAVALFSQSLPPAFRARVLGIMGLISVGFLLFLIYTSNPFQRIFSSIPKDGEDLNALLQDPGLLFHPPTLYMGYVGFSVAFAFAISALLSGKLDTTWARWTRPWTLAAWCFLTLGITAGSLWSYRELGWGGWWFWDPVENASFMPWLIGTALLHSLSVSEKRNAFHHWTILLAICAFSLSLVGTFLVRSGVLTSVHVFAVDPARGAFMLKFIAVVVGSALMLYAIRAPVLKSSKSHFYFLSRDSFLLLNNVLLLVAMATILLGTVYPLIIDALNLGKISVGAPYFNTMFAPLAMLLLFCMGIGPLCAWQQTNTAQLLKQLIYSFLISLLFGAIFPWLLSHHYFPWYVPVTLTLSVWAIMALLQNAFVLRRNLTFSRLGMHTAHAGVAICAIGIALSSAYSVERNVSMSVGDTASVGPYVFKLRAVHAVNGSNYTGTEGEFAVFRYQHLITILHAQNRVYPVQETALSKPAIDAGFLRDLYVALAEPLPDNTWAVRLYDKPFVRWIWAGGALIFLGGLLAVIDKKYDYRVKIQTKQN